MDEQRQFRASDADRERVLDLLQEAHAAGRLDLAELGQRQDAALAAKFTSDLNGLVADLPEAHNLPAVPTAKGVVASVPASGRSSSAFTMMTGNTVVLDPGQDRVRSFTMWGGTEVDLTEAMGPGVVVTVEASTLMGGTDIYVPTGVKVINKTFSFMGGSTVSPAARGDGSNGTLVVRGFCMWGGVVVSLPDEA